MEFGHVPVAVHYDLCDDNSNSLFGSVENANVRDDLQFNVDGYTYQELFNLLNNNIVTPLQYREALKTILPSGISGIMIEEIFTDYNY